MCDISRLGASATIGFGTLGSLLSYRVRPWAWHVFSGIGPVAVIGLGFAITVAAADQSTSVPMRTIGSNTYYVSGQIGGLGDVDMLVDTGSSYSTITPGTLEILQLQDRVRFVRKLRGMMADGRKLTVPIYRIGSISVGRDCWLHDVEAAVFPEHTRNILGLSALTKAAPFTFSLEPPALILSNCHGAPKTPLAVVPATNEEPPLSTGRSVPMSES